MLEKEICLHSVYVANTIILFEITEMPTRMNTLVVVMVRVICDQNDYDYNRRVRSCGHRKRFTVWSIRDRTFIVLLKNL